MTAIDLTFAERRALERAASLLVNPHTRQPDHYAARTPQGYAFCALGAYGVTNEGLEAFVVTGPAVEDYYGYSYPEGEWTRVTRVTDLHDADLSLDPSPINENEASAAFTKVMPDVKVSAYADHINVVEEFDKDPEGFTAKLKRGLGWIV